MADTNGLSRRKYKFLEQLAMEDLEYLLCLSSDSEEMEEFIDAITDIIVAREREHPTGRLPNVDDAWNEFLQTYNTPEKRAEIEMLEEELASNPAVPSIEKRPSRRRTTFRHIWHIAAAAVLAVVLTLGSMIGAQAAGVNVFGALAEWTDEFFHYIRPHSNGDLIRNALRDQDIPEELAPAWIPERYALKNVETPSNDEGNYATAEYVSTGDGLFIEISKYNDPVYLIGWDYQKDSDNAEAFISHGRKFYVLSNLDCTTATWSDGESLIINIWGDLSIEEMMDIISSIGGK